MTMPRNEPRISLQDSRHAHQEDDLSAPASPDQEHGSRTIEIKRIDIKRIIVDAERRSLQAERVKEISDSIRKIGLKTPVTVRLIDDGNVVLVSGLHRLQAAKSLGWDQIDAVYLDGDKRQARFWQISENLHRADLTVLERDEHIAEWLRLIDNSENISGQNVRRSRGRPEGGISLAARVLPVGGKSIEARRKSIERASQVDGISPEAKVTATTLGLANNRSALLAVAREATMQAQVALVKKLAGRKRDMGTSRANEADCRMHVEAASAEDEATFAFLKSAWLRASELVAAWAAAPSRVRDQFISEVLRGASASEAPQRPEPRPSMEAR